MSLPLNVEPSPQMCTSSECMARTSIVPVTARPSGVVLKYTRPADRTWKAPQASAASPSSTSSRRQSTLRASSAPYCSARSGTPETSGSSYWPMSAVYAHGIAPLSRIQATATEVSSPPENAMPTRSPTGREVRTLLTASSSRFEVLLASDRVREGQQVVGQRAPALGVAGHHEQGVVTGDRADDVRQAGAVERRGEVLGGAGGRAQDDEVAARLGGGEQLPHQPGEAVWGRVIDTARGDARAVLGDDVHRQAAVGWSELDGAELVQVAREGGLGDVNAGVVQAGGQLGLRPDGRPGEDRDDPRVPRRLGRRLQLGAHQPGPSRNVNNAFCACSRFSASSHTTLCGPSMTSAAISLPR